MGGQSSHLGGMADSTRSEVPPASATFPLTLSASEVNSNSAEKCQLLLPASSHLHSLWWNKETEKQVQCGLVFLAVSFHFVPAFVLPHSAFYPNFESKQLRVLYQIQLMAFLVPPEIKMESLCYQSYFLTLSFATLIGL